MKKKSLFWGLIAIAAIIALAACGNITGDPTDKPGINEPADEPGFNEPTDEPGGNDPVATLRYETVPYNGGDAASQSIVRSSRNIASSASGLDNLVFMDYDDDHNVYYFVLGHVNTAPLAYRPAVYYNGVTAITVGYSSTNVTQQSISNSITEASENTVTKSTSSTWGNEIGVSLSIESKFGFPLIGDSKVRLEGSYGHTWGGSESTDVSTARSFANTYETSRTTASEITDEISVTIGNNNEPTGLYRFSLFSITDVYFVVLTDRAKTSVVEANIVYCARPVQFWSLDYEPEQSGTFGKTASGTLLEIPDITISDLPTIPDCTHNWGIWITTKTATATTEGEEVRTCTLCQRTQTQLIPVTRTGTFNLSTGTWANGSGNAAFSGGVLTVNDQAQIIITTNGASTANRIVANGITHITLKDAAIITTGNNAMLLNSSANATVRLEGTNSLTSGGTYAGIRTTGATLTIDGNGSLTVTGGQYGGNSGAGAGIGGDGGAAFAAGSANGTVIINGGAITAQGGATLDFPAIYGGSGAGIGGGGGGGGGTGTNYSGGKGGAGGNITINTGSTVTANGGAGGPQTPESARGASYGGGGGGMRSFLGGGSNGAQGDAAILNDYRNP